MPKKPHKSARSAPGPGPSAEGLRAFNAGRFDQAISIWARFLAYEPRLAPAMAEAHFRRALTLPTPERITDLQRALELAPDEPRYRYHLALTLHQLRRFADAAGHYRTLIERGYTWPGLGLVNALLTLQQAPQPVDLETLPLLTPQALEVLRPLVALLQGAAPSADDTAVGQLWHGLAALRTDDKAGADQLFADERPLPSRQAAALRTLFRGLAATQSNSAVALEYLLDAYQSGVLTQLTAERIGALTTTALEAQLAAGDDTNAARLAQRVCELLPAPNAALAGLLITALDRGARALAQTGGWENAIVYWELARTVVGSSSSLGSPRPLLHNLALAYEAREDWVYAAEAWRAMLRTRPRKSRSGASAEGDYSDEQWRWVRARVIECYKRAGMPGEAVAIFRQAIKANPDDMDTRLQLVDALIANEQLQAAVNELARILSADPDNLEALLRQADIYLSTGQIYYAEAPLRRALALAPDREDVRRRMSRLLLQRGNNLHLQGYYEQAIATFEEGRGFDPQNPDFPLNLARVAVDRQQKKKAAEWLAMVMDMAGQEHSLFLDVFDCWVVADDLAEARGVLARAEQAAPLSADMISAFGAVIIKRRSASSPFGMPVRSPRSGKGAEQWEALALELFDRAVAMQPDDLHIAAQIAMDMLSTRPELALRYIEPVAAKFPNMPEPQMLLGLAQALNQRHKEARKTLQRAAQLARSQGNAEMAFQIEQLRQQVGSPFLLMSLQMGANFLDDLDDFDEDDLF